jgi:hypothetical protein
MPGSRETKKPTNLIQESAEEIFKKAEAWDSFLMMIARSSPMFWLLRRLLVRG